MSFRPTDALGNPVHVEDIITYPVQSGSSSAEMVFGRVEVIDEIIRLPSGAWTLHSYRNRRDPTHYLPIGKWEKLPDGRTIRVPEPGKNYIVKLHKLDWWAHEQRARQARDGRLLTNPRTTMLSRVNQIIVITDLMSLEFERVMDERIELLDRAL